MKSIGVFEPRCIRIFKTHEEAKFAQDVLSRAAIAPEIKEDKFRELTLADLGMQSRFRLYISKKDIKKAALFLVKELRKVQKV